MVQVGEKGQWPNNNRSENTLFRVAFAQIGLINRDVTVRPPIYVWICGIRGRKKEIFIPVDKAPQTVSPDIIG